MTSTLSSSQIFSLLRDIEQRSHQDSSQHNNQHSVWTAIGFRIANELFLVPLEQTREVFPLPAQITSVPKSEPWVFGIANLRGELLPLFDLKYFLYSKPTKVNKHSRIMVINHPDIYSGLLIDEVFGLKHVQQQPDQLQEQDNDIMPFVDGCVTQQDTQWKVFSFEKLASDIRFLNAAA
ncbi:MAG: chemotaxis protein CheW [Gammaproteobacteria bacterium]|nr:chemotaxis protein CheW [Gammaproteobacteria bacterium]